MNTQALLKKVEQFGIRLEVRGDKLRAEAPENLLTPELVAEFKAHKAEILATLIAQDHGLPLADLKQAAGPTWPEIEQDPAAIEALATACEGVTNPKISIGLHPYRYRLKNGKGGGTYLTPAATPEKARAELLRRWPDELLVVTKAGRTC